jgi:outer membrane protein TolC
MKQGVKVLIVLLNSLLAGVCFAAAETPVKPADPNNPRILDDYLYQSAMNNSGLMSAFEAWKAAIEQIPQAAALDDPQFTFSYFVREEMKNSDSPREQDYRIMQMFPWFGKLEARTDAAAAAAQAAHHRYEAARVKVVYQTSSVFYEFAYLARAVDVAKDSLELMKHFEQVAREKYRTAAGSHPDVVRAQIELATMEEPANGYRPFVAERREICARGD